MFSKDVCRSLPLDFEKEIDLNGIPGYRYKNALIEKDVRNGKIKFEHNILIFDSSYIHRFFRFVPSEDIFAKPTKNPFNKCFYEENEPYNTPHGLFNVSACQHDTPIFVSWPHFYQVSDN